MEGMDETIRNTLQEWIWRLPRERLISLGTIIQAKAPHSKEPTIQCMERMPRYGPRYLLRIISDMYENITGSDPPTLQGTYMRSE